MISDHGGLSDDSDCIKRKNAVIEAREPIVFPEHALLIVEERLKDQQAEGIRMPDGMEA
jgi:hypothetical protein